MSGLSNSFHNGSTSNLTGSAGRPFPPSYPSLSGAPSPGFHHSGSVQGMQNIHGSFGVPNMPGALATRNYALNGVPSAGMQQATGGLGGGRFISSNLPGALPQMSHGSSVGFSGVMGRGGLSFMGGSHGYTTSTNGAGSSIPGIMPFSATSGIQSAIPGSGVSPMMTNAGQSLASSMGNMVDASSVGRNISSSGGINMGGHASRPNISANTGTGNLNIPGSNRLIGSGLPQASPQGISMHGNSYFPNNFQTENNLTSMGTLNNMNNSENAPLNMNDFPRLSSRPSSNSGHQQQIGSTQKQGSGAGQQNQEFSIQNEDFPALSGFKGGKSNHGKGLHRKKLHNNTGRSSGSTSIGGNISTHQSQQQPLSGSSTNVDLSQLNNQDLLHSSGSDMSSQSNFHAQTKGLSGIGLRPQGSSNTVSGMSSYDHGIQQYQQQNQSQYCLPQMSSSGQPNRDLGSKSAQSSQSTPDPFGLHGLLSIVHMKNPNLTSLAIGVDLTTLGLNLNSAENLYKTFSSPWSDEPAKGDPEFSIPQFYYGRPPPPLHPSHFSKFQLQTLFYIFYSLPKDEMQIYAANELYNRGWFYHREHRLWLTRVPNSELLVKSTTYERGHYLCFDSITFDTVRKDNFVVHYEMVEKRPALPQHH